MKRLVMASMVAFTLADPETTLAIASPAGHQAINAVVRVLARLDEASPPNYPTEGFLDRQGLTDRVIGVMLEMVDPGDAADWCPLMSDISDNDPRYFDGRINPNPARDRFTHDWLKAARAAGCLPSRTTPQP
jgi:hypothetical protein